MRLETSFTIFGYPAIALGFFLIGAICGLRLVYRAGVLPESLSMCYESLNDRSGQGDFR